MDCDPLQGRCCEHTDGDKEFVYMVLWSPTERDPANPLDSQYVLVVLVLFVKYTNARKKKKPLTT